ncbi:hypothetical protein ACFL2D_02875 [Patescibacteria group bacterium]
MEYRTVRVSSIGFPKHIQCFLQIFSSENAMTEYEIPKGIDCFACTVQMESDARYRISFIGVENAVIARNIFSARKRAGAIRADPDHKIDFIYDMKTKLLYEFDPNLAVSIQMGSCGNNKDHFNIAP